MANVIVAAIAVALVLGAALTLSNAALSSASDIALSWDSMVDRKNDRLKTEMELITADISGSGADIDTSIRNTGQTSLGNFARWDVMVNYYASGNNTDLRFAWLTYVTSATPAHQQWTVEGIYLDADTQEAEVYEPNIFNPGEEMVIRLNITPAIATSTDSVITIGTENGVTLTAPFSR